MSKEKITRRKFMRDAAVGTVGVAVVAVAVLIMLTSNAKAGPFSGFKPVWSTGQTWKVEVEKETVPPSVPKKELAKWKPRRYRIGYKFTVEEPNNMKKEICYQVRVETISIDGNSVSKVGVFYRIFVRKTDFTLKCIQRIYPEKNKNWSSKVFANGPVNATDMVSSVPVSFPFFDAETEYLEPRVWKSKDGSITHRITNAYQRCKQTKWIVNDKEKEALSIIIEKNESGKKVEAETSEIWVKGLPWWCYAMHKKHGKEWCTGKLIEVNGKKITSRAKTE